MPVVFVLAIAWVFARTLRPGCEPLITRIVAGIEGGTPAEIEPDPPTLASSDREVPARIEPEPPTLSDTSPSVLATLQSPQPPLPSSTERAPRPTAP